MNDNDSPPAAERSEAEGRATTAALIRLLDLERLEDNLFRGVSPENSTMRVFGGQVAAQALTAAGRTVPPDRRVHSLHAYFLRPGDPRVPIVFDVDRTRDGQSFTTRRVIAIQHGKPIFTLSSSFQLDQPGVDHSDPMPVVPRPETLPTFAERMQAAPQPAGLGRVPRPFDVRYVNDPPWASDAEPRSEVRNQVWFRSFGALPDDQLLHVCMLAYLSDLTLLDSILATHGLGWSTSRLSLASLDHAMWFHRPIRVDDWVLYDTHSPSASGSRGLAMGHFFAADGAMLATVVQEGLVRVGVAPA
ncbi:acyl-CoA thioesterase [Nakamurella panacisegetis]|uniref:acyl-CoA thioesterase n=1 Tax=Nakamurella panacisegetis TaxID=1090615 RepID=UPI001E565605|nr:acyl-CoA thioesterase II [Nakamurella panacisegetis]